MINTPMQRFNKRLTKRLASQLILLMATVLFVIVSAVVSPHLRAHADNQSPTTPPILKRNNFGRNAYPIWSPLSFFESQTIAERHLAEAGNPDALLALYIMASGRYSVSDFNVIKKQIDRFIRKLTEHTDSILDPWQQGDVLNSAMHHHFFRSPSPNKSDKTQSQSQPPSHYSLDQSTLTGIFKNNNFNCISSTLLYAVLARHLNLEGYGVMLPSHAFIQLNFEDSKTAEVETTSPQGYDQHHDAEFYQRAAQSWFNPRGLEPSSYNDYLNRELIPFWQLGTRNMLHQHTHPHNMDAVTRGRLAEISAFLDPSYEPAQINRMHYYGQEITALSHQAQWSTLSRFFNQVMETLASDIQLFSENHTLNQSFFQLNLAAINTFAHTQALDTAVHYIRTSQQLAQNHEQLNQATLKGVAALNTLLKHFVEQQDFNQGLYAITAIEPFSSNAPEFALSVTWFYHQWAKTLWAQDLWPDVIDVYEGYLVQPYLAPDLKDTHTNLSRAYLNWTLAELALNHTSNASSIIEQCQASHHTTNLCLLAKQALASHKKH